MLAYEITFILYILIITVVSAQVGEPVAWCLESNAFLHVSNSDIKYFKVFNYNFSNPF